MDSITDDLLACLHDEQGLAADCARHLAGSQPAEPLRVAVCGIYNAGKSSLLNALVGSFGARGEAFRTGAARVTSKVSELRTGQVIHIDTPGIDGGELDDATAFVGVDSADCVLYAHRLLMAEFDQQERAWLEGLATRLDDARSRVALVITQVDEVVDEKDAARHLEDIVAAFRSATGFDPVRSFAVSSSRFMKGMGEDKYTMVERSGIPALVDWIEACSADATLCATFRRQRWAAEAVTSRRRIRGVADRVLLEHDALAADFNARAGAFETAASRLARQVRDEMRRLDAFSTAGASGGTGGSVNWWPFSYDKPAQQLTRGSDARPALFCSLARQACGNASAGMRALLAAHAGIVAGEVEPIIGLNELRRVASYQTDASGVATLAPLTVGLDYVEGYREVRRRIDELAARLANLDKLMERTK